MLNRHFYQWTYTFLLTLSLPLLFLRMYLRGRKNPLYRERWAERLSIFKAPPKKNGIWLHAVSAGEAIAAAPLVRALKKAFPEVLITMTTFTPNGSARVQQLLGKEVFHVYFPFDLPLLWQIFLKKLQPKLCLLMETELWPNCLSALKKHQIPAMIVNARLSPRSVIGYQKLQKFGKITSYMMSCLHSVAAQSALDGDRFLQLGLSPDRLQVLGNIKFDMPSFQDLAKEAAALRQTWDNTRPVWIAASTHAGEETVALKAFLLLRQHFPKLLLILAPRHTERREEVIAILKQHNLSFAVRTHQDPVNSETAVLLVDTMGEMPLFYRTADVAFVGGSFVPVGGHNTLEPAHAAIPVAVGPHVHNFVEITKLLSEADALIQVQDANALSQTLAQWFSDEQLRKTAGQRGFEVVEGNRGAVQKTIALIKPLL